MSGFVLGIDSATARCSVALHRGKQCWIAPESLLQGIATSCLLTAVDMLCQQARIGPTEIAQVVVGLGPGSFTGIRVAMATAKGIAQALEATLLGIGSLALLALDVACQRGIQQDHCIGSLVTARQGLVAAAVYQWQAAAQQLSLVLPVNSYRADDATLLQYLRNPHIVWGHEPGCADKLHVALALISGPCVCGYPNMAWLPLLERSAALWVRQSVATMLPDYSRAPVPCAK